MPTFLPSLFFLFFLLKNHLFFGYWIQVEKMPPPPPPPGSTESDKKGSSSTTAAKDTAVKPKGKDGKGKDAEEEQLVS